MPELPEVESTVAYLRDKVSGALVQDVQVAWKRSVSTPSKAVFIETLRGARFTSFFRRAKFVGIVITTVTGEERHLLFHMRMTGSFDVVNKSEPRQSHDRITITLQDGRQLRFHDPRKFGRAYLVSHVSDVTGTLGYEPLDHAFGLPQLRSLVAGRKGAIKAFLLNQRHIAGIGNIYADEILWAAGIHPCSAPRALRESQLVKLLSSMRGVLTEAIEKLGTDFGDGVVEMGGYQPRAYGREGKACQRCGSKIQRVLVAQRGTHYCRRCQRLQS